MELTAQMAALEEELKVLKGEIKSILTEIRTSVLTRDNPFAPVTGVPVFRPVERSPSGDNAPDEGEPLVEEDAPATAVQEAAATEPPEPLPKVARVQPSALPPEAGAGPASTNVHPKPPPEPEPDRRAPSTAWSIPTIAGLVAWADETASRIGPAHMQMVLELARFAGLISPEAEEPLLKIVKLASSRKDGAAASVNDFLVALRQLEAIFRGEISDELAVLRRQRAT